MKKNIGGVIIARNYAEKLQHNIIEKDSDYSVKY